MATKKQNENPTDPKAELATLAEIPEKFEGEEEVQQRPLLRLDNGTGENPMPGRFHYSGQVLKEMKMVFFTRRVVRSLFQHAYTDKTVGASPIVCQSWGNSEAFGTQEHVAATPHNVAERDCSSCKLAAQFVCRPCSTFLVMIHGTLEDGSQQGRWMPAIWNTRGAQVKPTDRQYSEIDVYTHSVPLEVNGKKVKMPRWMVQLTVRSHRPNPSRQSYVPTFSEMQQVKDESVIEQLVAFAREARQVWEWDIEQHRQQAYLIGQTDSAQDDRPRINEGEVPF